MDRPVSIKWLYTQQVEKEIRGELDITKGFPLVEHVNDLMQELRNTAQETIFLDFQYAVEQGVESRLWGVHTLVKDRHKKLVNGALKKEPRNLVEVRKLQKHYADFIKKSQFFYRGYIQRLASTYCGMKGLRRIAHRLSLETLSADNMIQVSPELERLIDASCHATLLRLGDLSRYRNEIRVKDRSWESALGFYSLAGNLCPDSGSSHNQIAVIALADQDHLEALYHLHRAIAIKEPYPMAKSNLEIEFKKIVAAWDKKPISHTKVSNEATLILWFVRLQAKLYKGEDFLTHNELEDEVLFRLARLLKEQSFEATLEKIVITSIAAEYFAAERLQDSNASPDAMKSFHFLLRFNIRMIIVLLQTLQPELEETVTGEELPRNVEGSQSTHSREKISAISRRILPVLRQYSTWIVARSPVIAQAATTSNLGLHVVQMWTTYADTMTKIAAIFPVEELDTVDYLLEEDETTVGFKPLRDQDLPAESNLYVDEDGRMKPRFTDPGIERSHPNVEMVARIRDILLCALTLYAEQKAPITLDNMRFVYVEGFQYTVSPVTNRSVASPIASPDHSSHPTTCSSISQEKKGFTSGQSAAAFDSQQCMDTDMHRMVDSLLGPSSGRHTASNETSYGMHSLTANDIFVPMASSGIQAPQQSTPKILPSLPGIWNSPFTPQPHELQPTSPERPSTGRQLSPFQLSTSEKQFAAAAALDKRTGYGSWGRKSSRPTSNPLSQSVSQSLQESLSQQFMPLTTGSSGFTDSSSIYANTPRAENRFSGSGFRGHHYGNTNGNNTTTYAGASDFEQAIMLQSSLWDGSQPVNRDGYIPTPPGGQGG